MAGMTARMLRRRHSGVTDDDYRVLRTVLCTPLCLKSSIQLQTTASRGAEVSVLGQTRVAHARILSHIAWVRDGQS